jgi:hypothetical protein
VAVCGQNNVGLTPGASLSATVTETISYTTGVPEPAAWTLMLLGVCGLGGALRKRRSSPRALAA